MAFDLEQARSNPFLFLALLICCSVLLVLTMYTRYLATFESVLRFITQPVVVIAYLPRNSIEASASYLTSNATLRTENTALRTDLAELQAMRTELNEAYQRINELTTALQYRPHVRTEQRLAEVVALNPDRNRQEVTINLGSKHGVNLDSTLLDPHGLYGRTIEVFDDSARVLLVIDKRSGIPVLVTRTSEFFVLSGNGAGELMTLDNVNFSSDVQVGDELVTSGFGDVYPAGYTVGTVSAVVDNQSEATKFVTVAPAAVFNQKSYLRVLIHPGSS